MKSLAPTEVTRRKRVFLSALLAAVTLLLYLPVVHHGFIDGWDDDDYVTTNVHVRSGLTLANVAWAFRSFEQSNWHPVTWISHMLDCQLFGMNPGAHHYINVLLHTANVLLLFWILSQGTGAVWRSFFVAALCAVHPLNVETVAWVAQRKSLLSAFFSLLTIAAYGWYIKRVGLRRYSAIVFTFGLALMAKAMAVTLPLLLVLFDYWPLRRFEQLSPLRRWPRLTIEKLPLFVMSAACSVLTGIAQRSGGSVMPMSMLPLTTRIQNAAISYVTYIGKILWPARLGVFYPLNFSPSLGDTIASAIILVGVSTLVVYLRRAPYLLVGWFIFLIGLIPTIGFVQVGFQGMADRYAYVPSVGLFIATTWGLASLVEGLPMARFVLSAASLCVIAGLAASTAHYLRFWQNGVTLCAQARAAWGRPDMWLEQLYGNALLSSGRVDEALEHYRESCAIEPRTEYCHYAIANILSRRRQYRAALQEYQLAIKFTANRNIALRCFNESSAALVQLGEYDAARRSIAAALSIDPGDATATRLREQISNKSGSTQ